MQDLPVYTLLYSGIQRTEVTGDFTLPDYLPDVRRILRVSAEARVTSRSMTGERLTVTGDAALTLLYCSEENTVRAFQVSIPFSHSISVAGLDESAFITAKLTAENTSCRLIGPRRCTLRTTPSINVRALAARKTAPDTNALSDAIKEGALYTHTTPVPASCLTYAARDGLRYAEDIPLKNARAASVLRCSCEVCVSECRTAEGSVTLKGTLEVCVLCAVMEDGAIRNKALTCSIPFAETLEDGCIREGDTCEPDITVTAVTPSIVGDGSSIGVDCTVDISCICAQNVTLDIVCDAYLSDRDVAISLEEQTVIRPHKTIIGTIPLTHTVKTDSQARAKALIDASARITQERCEIAGGKIKYQGTAELSMIFENEDGEFVPELSSTPIQFEADAPPVDPAHLYTEADCRPSRLSFRFDESGTAAFDGECSILLTVMEKSKIHLPRCLTTTDEPTFEAPKYPLILCYPQSGESLWDIAKRYHVSTEVLCRANDLDPDTGILTTDASPLLIPIHEQFSLGIT